MMLCVKSYWIVFVLLFFVVACSTLHGEERSPERMDPTQADQSKSTTKKVEVLAKKKDLLTQVLHHYRRVGGVKMKVQKKIFLALLEKEKKASGELLLSKGNLKLELDKPEKSLVVVNKKNLWWVQYDSDNKPQISRLKTSKAYSKSLLAQLLNDGNIWDELKKVKKTKDKATVSLWLKPKPKSKLKESTVKIKIVLKEKTKLIQSLEYWDNLDNKTEYQFSKIKVLKKVSYKKFDYKPPQSAKVNDF